MADYRHMYAILCAAASEALDRLPDTPETAEGRALLQRALFAAEEAYMESADAEADCHGPCGASQ